MQSTSSQNHVIFPLKVVTWHRKLLIKIDNLLFIFWHFFLILRSRDTVILLNDFREIWFRILGDSFLVRCTYV